MSTRHRALSGSLGLGTAWCFMVVRSQSLQECDKYLANHCTSSFAGKHFNWVVISTSYSIKTQAWETSSLPSLSRLLLSLLSQPPDFNFSRRHFRPTVNWLTFPPAKTWPFPRPRRPRRPSQRPLRCHAEDRHPFHRRSQNR